MKPMMPQFRGVRNSKFRHVYGSPVRRENCYENLRITQDMHDSNCCAVNTTFLAVITQSAGGGSFIVLPLEQTGRQGANVFKVGGHQGSVLDLKWNPFNDYVIASASEDTTVKVWKIADPMEGSASIVADLRGHSRRTTFVEWHPVAENILASVGFDHVILIWNVASNTIVSRIDCHKDVIYGMSFNSSGSRLATTSRDKRIRIIEPLHGRLLQEGLGHAGSKPCKVVYLGSTGKVLTTGSSKQSDRQYAVWNDKDLGTPLRMETIDSSSGTLFPFFDPDTGIVYIAGKGDGNIRFYEVVSEKPWIHYLGQYMSGFPQRGLGYIPKRGLNISQCEVFRFYKLHASRDLCEPVSMTVPRRDNQTIHADLYPDTGAPIPAVTAEEWMHGIERKPVMMSLITGQVTDDREPLEIPGQRSPMVKVEGYSGIPDTPSTSGEMNTRERLPTQKSVDDPSGKILDTPDGFVAQTLAEQGQVLGAEEEGVVSSGERAESGYEDLPTSSDDEDVVQERNKTSFSGEEPRVDRSRKRTLFKNHVREMIDQLEEQTKNKATFDGAKVPDAKTVKRTQLQRINRSPRSMTQPILTALSQEHTPKPPTTRQAGYEDLLKERNLEIIEKPLLIKDLRRSCEEQAAEIRSLKEQLVIKDRRIRELENQIKTLLQKST